MPLIIASAQATPNRYPHQLTNQQCTDAKDAIDALQYTDLFSGAGTLRNPAHSLVRVDMQGNFQRTGNTWSNIQAQVNNVHGHTTVACAEVNQTSIQTTNSQNQQGALKKVKEVLKKSLYEGHVYTVAGSVP